MPIVCPLIVPLARGFALAGLLCSVLAAHAADGYQYYLTPIAENGTLVSSRESAY